MELFFGDGIFCGKVLDKPCPVCYNSARRMCSDEKNMRVWRNWQTRMIQVHIEAIRWRFKSSYPHQTVQIRTLNQSVKGSDLSFS